MAKGATRSDSAGRLSLEDFEDELVLDPAALGPSLPPDEVGRVANELLNSNVLQSRWLSSAGKPVRVLNGAGEMRTVVRELLHLKSGLSVAEVMEELNELIPARPRAQTRSVDHHWGWFPPGTVPPRRRRLKLRNPAVERATACRKSLSEALARAIRQAADEGRMLVFKPTQFGYELVAPEKFPQRLPKAESKALRFVLTRDLPNSLLRAPERRQSTGPHSHEQKRLQSKVERDIQELAALQLPIPKKEELFKCFQRKYQNLTKRQMNRAWENAAPDDWKKGGKTRKPLAECLPEDWKKHFLSNS